MVGLCFVTHSKGSWVASWTTFFVQTASRTKNVNGGSFSSWHLHLRYNKYYISFVYRKWDARHAERCRRFEPIVARQGSLTAITLWQHVHSRMLLLFPLSTRLLSITVYAILHKLIENLSVTLSACMSDMYSQGKKRWLRRRHMFFIPFQWPLKWRSCKLFGESTPYLPLLIVSRR